MSAINAGAGMNTAVNVDESSVIVLFDRVTYLIVAFLFVVPFSISFSSLTGLAQEMGMAWPFLFPLMIDGGLLGFKFLVLVASLRGRTDWLSWTLAGLLTLCSVGLNIAHVPPESPNWWLAAFMYALPPLLIFLVFFAVARRIEERAKVQGAAINLEGVLKRIKEARISLRGIEQETAKAEAARDTAVTEKKRVVEEAQQVRMEFEAYRSKVEKERDALAQSLAELAAKEEAGKARLARLEAAPSPKPAPVKVDAPTAVGNEAQPEDIMLIMQAEPDVSQAEIARRLQMSKSWVSGKVKELKENRLVLQNGHGWEVLS